jgi:hypothetical protein
MHGPTSVFWANLTPLSLQTERLLLEDAPESLAWTFGATPFLHACSTGQVQLGLYPTFQYSSTTLYQFSYHIQSLFFESDSRISPQVQCAEVLVAAGCDTAATMANGFTGGARPHCRFVLSFIHFIP